MAKNDEEESRMRFYIPQNFEEAGGYLGGKIGRRNGIELLVICGPLAYIELKTLHFSLEVNICIAMVTLIPLAFLCIFGIQDESITEYLMAIYRYRRGRRKLYYDSFTRGQESREGASNQFDLFVEEVASTGWKQAIRSALNRKGNEKTKAKAEKSAREGKIVSDAERKSIRSRKHRRLSEGEIDTAKTERKNQENKRSLISSATKEMLLRKLELTGDDEGF